MRLSFFLISALIAAVKASNVIELNADNWDSVVGDGKPGLVEL